MTPRFIDTGYWLALIDESDRLHRAATRLAVELTGPFVTTEAILVEVGSGLAGARWRGAAVQLLRRIRVMPHLEIVPVSTALLERAIALYAARPDKEWGLTDCISCVVMQERGRREALAADLHVQQAGFRALLR